MLSSSSRARRQSFTVIDATGSHMDIIAAGTSSDSKSFKPRGDADAGL